MEWQGLDKIECLNYKLKLYEKEFVTNDAWTFLVALTVNKQNEASENIVEKWNFDSYSQLSHHGLIC